MINIDEKIPVRNVLNIFYDGILFQHLVTVLISVFTLCYGPGLLFRGPFRIIYTPEFFDTSTCVFIIGGFYLCALPSYMNS
jgi:hypothetical protein